MFHLLSGVFLLVSTALAAADDRPAERLRPEIDVVVPIDPQGRGQVEWFGRQERGRVPGTVTINRPGYVCDVDRRTFSRREDFLDHLEQAHKVPQDRLEQSVTVVRGQVHFTGR